MAKQTIKIVSANIRRTGKGGRGGKGTRTGQRVSQRYEYLALATLMA